MKSLGQKDTQVSQIREGGDMKKRAGLFLVAVFALVGCASAQTKIMSASDGSFTVVSKAYNEKRAYQGARDAAAEHCKKQGKSVVFSDNRDEMQKTASRTPQRVRSGSEREKATKSIGDVEASEDPQISLTFKCR
jgi:hypothetical protein